MVALIVIGAIALLIFILLASSVTVDMEYDRVFRYRVRYLFFTFVRNPESKRQIKKRQRKKLKEKKKQEKSRRKKGAHLKQRSDKKPQKSEVSELKKGSPAKSEQAKPEQKEQEQGKPAENASEKPKLKFSLDLIKRITGRAGPHVKRIFKKIRLSHVVIDITAGGDDAAKAAISYGVHCAAVNGFISFLNSVIRLNVERIRIMADFELPKNEYYARAKLKLRLSTLLHSGIWGFFAVLSELRKDSVAGENTSPEEKKAA